MSMTDDQWEERVGKNLRSHLDAKIMMLVEYLQVTLNIEYGPNGGLTREDRLDALRLVNAIGSLGRIAKAKAPPQFPPGRSGRA